ncbi:MAG TPA: acyl-CoA dehydrogenase family protein [Gammaproteobacteria bacterium]
MDTQDDVARLLGALDEVAPLVRGQAAEADRRAAFSDEVVEALVRHRLFRLWIPRRYGGLELTLPEALEIYRAAARIDGSFGWAVMIGAGGGLFAAYLEPDAALEIFGPPAAVIAGSGAPHGRAERVDGGYRVRGRWRYASGAPYATTFTANCVVTAGGEPVPDARGEPLVRAMSFPRRDVEIVETWDTTGMRATASHDFGVDDVFVPERLTFSVFTDAPREPGPLYRLPFEVLTELPITAVAVGIARHALEAFKVLATQKTPYGTTGVLADDPLARAAFARSHAAWRAAERAMLDLAERAWRSAVDDRALPADERAEITAACAHGVATLRAATDELVALAGMSGVEQASELARAGRDLATLAAHFSVAPRQLAGAGGTLLRAAPDVPAG